MHAAYCGPGCATAWTGVPAEWARSPAQHRVRGAKGWDCTRFSGRSSTQAVPDELSTDALQGLETAVLLLLAASLRLPGFSGASLMLGVGGQGSPGAP